MEKKILHRADIRWHGQLSPSADSAKKGWQIQELKKTDKDLSERKAQKFKKRFHFFICILPDYVSHENPNEF